MSIVSTVELQKKTKHCNNQRRQPAQRSAFAFAYNIWHAHGAVNARDICAMESEITEHKKNIQTHTHKTHTHAHISVATSFASQTTNTARLHNAACVRRPGAFSTSSRQRDQPQKCTAHTTHKTTITRVSTWRESKTTSCTGTVLCSSDDDTKPTKNACGMRPAIPVLSL